MSKSGRLEPNAQKSVHEVEYKISLPPICSSTLGQRPRLIPCQNEQRPNHGHSADENQRPRHRQTSRRVVDVDIAIHDPAEDIPNTQDIQRGTIQAGHIPRHHRRGEETDILEAVLLGALGADDAAFGGGVDALVF